MKYNMSNIILLILLIISVTILIVYVIIFSNRKALTYYKPSSKILPS